MISEELLLLAEFSPRLEKKQKKKLLFDGISSRLRTLQQQQIVNVFVILQCMVRQNKTISEIGMNNTYHMSRLNGVSFRVRMFTTRLLLKFERGIITEFEDYEDRFTLEELEYITSRIDQSLWHTPNERFCKYCHHWHADAGCRSYFVPNDPVMRSTNDSMCSKCLADLERILHEEGHTFDKHGTMLS